MDEVGFALIAISLVLIAVFVPTAFIAGLQGTFYRQFAITIAAATAISALVSLTLSPALAAMLLKPHGAAHEGTGSCMRSARRCAGFRRLQRTVRTPRQCLRDLDRPPGAPRPCHAAGLCGTARAHLRAAHGDADRAHPAARSRLFHRRLLVAARLHPRPFRCDHPQGERNHPLATRR